MSAKIIIGEDEAAQLLFMYADGKSIRDLSNHTGYSTTTIHKFLKENDVDTGSRSNHVNLPKHLEDEISNKYINGETISGLSRYYQLGVFVIRKILCNRGINIKTNGYIHDIQKSLEHRFRDDEIDILNGLILGDAYIRNQSNTKSHLNLYSIHKDYLIYLCGKLSILENREGNIGTRFNKRTQKTSYWINSKSYLGLTEIHRKWYIPEKRVPEEIVLAPNVCKFWYISDGSIQYKDRIVELATNGFYKSDVELLIEKLNNIGFKARIKRGNKSVLERNNDEKGYVIIFSATDCEKWLEYIGTCDIPCFEYKWGFRPRIKK